ncbi:MULTISPECIES: enoyl-CoA hydratase/isomerase family protein [Catenuloplanes]|uniref:Enoyl-CoA hydratase/carnithine racemase n=1 Tax=Catenuloplanes niger TaxID=587534 RepID=A0AAE4CV16_9ACTN|nr:enoyl-CoA hydratase/isomerase family protein [Catenuloplanes niger]MDR7326891.1 enoyl-CoA hydratase/carnithine racemase [Catenuloplanes niger]
MTGRLDARVDGAIATVTITNPRKRNVMTADMWRALPTVLSSLAADPAVRVLVLRGADGTFCAGADLANIAEAYPGGEDSIVTRAEAALVAFPRPTVAYVEGYAIGGGCQLAVACDLRFAAADAVLGVPPGKLGIVYPHASTRRLVSVVGPATAKYLLFSGDPVGAPRAAELGLVDEIATPDRLAEFTATLTSRSPMSLAAAKAFVESTDPAVVEHWHRVGIASPDRVEGVAAFHEKRPARF